ncbi:MAG: hypothetical protein ACRCW0_06375 [Clostridium sp.]
MLENITVLNKINVCPLCNHGIKPQDLGYISTEKGFVLVQKCPLCGSSIISECRYTNKSKCSVIIEGTYPIKRENEEFCEDIKNISSNFVEIYNQSKTAERIGLFQICGVGYRKALEHLVKDYAKMKNPEDIEAIEKRPLKQCIEAYIDHPKIKKCILGATYLGNDETHYIRKIENKDINDLKTLIKLSTLWIEMDETTLRYENDPELNLN